MFMGGGVLWVPAPLLRMAASLLSNFYELPASFRGAGGGEVSGGGTLYMKWGAENNYSHKRGLWGERK
jgi:hypothetical protein